MQSQFDKDIGDELDAKKQFLTAVTRRGLIKPSDVMYVFTVHASSLFKFIITHGNAKQILLACHNRRSTFIQTFMHMIEDNEYTAPICDVKCESGHAIKRIISRVAFTVFNTCSKNFVSELNDKIHQSRKRPTKANPKTSNVVRKQKKLAST